MKSISKWLFIAMAVLLICGFLNFKQKVLEEHIFQSKLSFDRQPVYPGEGKQKNTNMANKEYAVFENEQVAIYCTGQASAIINKQTGQRIRVNHCGVVHNINDKARAMPPLVGETIEKGIKLVTGDVITIISTKPVFKVLATYPNPRTGKDKIIIDKGTNTLFFYKKGELYKSYPVATGKDPLYTPEGVFKVANKIVDHGQELKPQLGEHWIGLAVPFERDNRAEKDARAPLGSKYGIHGTNEPDSIGKYASGGCIRMGNEQVAELFQLVEINTPVEIRAGK